MLLGARFEGVIEITGEKQSISGRPYYEASLVSDDGQMLHIFAGQLKELPNDRLEIGRRYRISFRPFVNNRWLEIKIAAIEPLEG